MKHIKIFAIAFASLLTFSACDGDDDNEIPTGTQEGKPQPTTYHQSATLDAQGSQQTVTLNNLTTKIVDVTNTNQWLTVLISTYTSGSPSIVLSATENTDTQERSGSVTITATNGNMVILTVTQEGMPTGIDDSHDVYTDKPAFSR